jgi:protein O-mannosyl-transferase
VVLCLGVLAAILYLYSPALHGHFIFDDSEFPFCKPLRHAPLSTWIATVGVRPVLIFSYWLNYHFGGVNPFGYHFANVMIHFVNTGLVFLVLLRILRKAEWTGRKAQVASFVGALVFAIHPLQTESVSYISGRSESLASLFMLLAYVVFIYRREESISWAESLLVLLFFAAAVKTKENAVSLVPILIFTDLFWPVPFSVRGLRRNWRLYGLMIPGAAVAVVVVFRLRAASGTAGFGVATFKWYQYAFTEARAIFTYIRMAVWPVDLSLDHDFATSHTILEHGAICWMILLASLVVVSVIFRRRYPLFCFGLLMFLICLAPTSSIVPLDDALVERRMYLALIGLILIGCELGRRVRLSPTVGVAVLCLVGFTFGKLCFDRNRLWGDPDKLIEMAAANAVHNPRPLLNFTEILIQRNQCAVAPRYLARAERRLPNNYFVNVAWGRTLACMGYFDEAVKRLRTAAQLQPCSQVYEWLGLVYAQMGRLEDAGGSLKKAVGLDPQSGTAHGPLALWYEKNHDFADAEQEYRMAASIDRDDSWAQQGWVRARQEERETRATF